MGLQCFQKKKNPGSAGQGLIFMRASRVNCYPLLFFLSLIGHAIIVYIGTFMTYVRI